MPRKQPHWRSQALHITPLLQHRTQREGGKRARDSSRNSKGSERNNALPPPKRSYAETAKRPDYSAFDNFWPENQLRVFKNTKHYEPISFQDFVDLREKLSRETFSILRADNFANRALIQMSGTYFNKVLHCGIINCKPQSLAWFKDAVSRVSEGEFRGWSKDELVTTCVKIFVPSGFETFTTEEYIEATRLMFETEETLGFPWIIIRDYVHHSRNNKLIIAQIPETSFEHIKSLGKETSQGSGVWKADGFMAPLKLTIASASDVHNTRTNHNIPVQQQQGNTPNQKNQNTQQNTNLSSPMPSPLSSPISSPRQDPESAAELPLGLLFEDKDPLLSTYGMSPLRSAMENTHVTNNQEEEMDYNLLASPTQSGESWADQ